MSQLPPRTGTLFLVGLGPGSPGQLTPDAADALDAADTIVGYHGYLELVAERIAGKAVVGRDLGQEVERARAALELAEQGRTVALVSSGDAGVYGMGGVAWELAAGRPAAAEIVVVPGITAACSAAARLGAPLAHDWACISLSDLLTPWETIVRRVDAAARADFVLVFYNPASRKRSHQLPEVARRLLEVRAPGTPVGLVENAYRPGERVEVVTLLDLALGKARVSMFTTVVVGSSRTFVAHGKMVTPRIYAAKQGDESAGEAHADAPAAGSPGDRIMSESLALIDRELGVAPADLAERAIVRRAIHATADFEFAETLRFTREAVAGAIALIAATRPDRPLPIVTDVEMLRAGIRPDLARPLAVAPVCFLNDPRTEELARERGLTRSAAGILRAVTELGGSPALFAIGNAPTALEALLDVAEGDPGFRPGCIVGLPVGFVGVQAAKSRLLESGRPAITNVGRKGGTAVAAAVVNALLDLAGAHRGPRA